MNQMNRSRFIENTVIGSTALAVLPALAESKSFKAKNRVPLSKTAAEHVNDCFQRIARVS